MDEILLFGDFGSALGIHWLGILQISIAPKYEVANLCPKALLRDGILTHCPIAIELNRR